MANPTGWRPWPCAPARLFDRLADEPGSFYLDSSLADPKLGRWSFLGSRPFLTFSARGRRWTIKEGARTRTGAGDPFAELARLVSRFRQEPESAAAPLAAGAVGWVSYEAGRLRERLRGARPPEAGLPDLWFGFYSAVAAFDHVRREVRIGGGRLTGPRGPMHARQAARADALRDALWSAAKPAGPPLRVPFGLDAPLRWDRSKESYLEAVGSVKDLIARGEIYQANLTRRAQARYTGDPAELYGRLRAVSPAPFGAYLNAGRIRICSASPERFLQVRGSRVETRPIKGTRPRGATAAADRQLALDLVRSPKDAAEHVMIVDLERNDLGTICATGSVKVSELAALEKFPQVHHLTSTVEGRLTRGTSAAAALAALFPGGSITGAPKIRSEEILLGLEPEPRGVYTGAIGYLSFAGDADFSVAIRTITLNGRHCSFGVGGGIVADSDPEEEWDETWAKASGLLAALGAPATPRDARVPNPLR